MFTLYNCNIRTVRIFTLLEKRLHILCGSHLAATGSKLRNCLRSFSTSPTRCLKLEDVAKYIKQEKFKEIVVMAGAGISTASGITDFRTPGTGLYDNLQKYNLPYAEAIFDISYFSTNPKPFFSFARELCSSGKYKPNLAHYFVRLLHEKGRLLRMYTQNIDGLERLAGIPEDKLVEAHGTFAKATCQRCGKSYKGEEIQPAILKGEIPKCEKDHCHGVIKPDIVFFGEMLPECFYQYLSDLPQADLLIVMGTSLEVHPFAGIAEAVLPNVPRILFNKELAGGFMYRSKQNDVISLGDLQETLSEFCELLGWLEECRKLMNNAEMSSDD